MNVKALNKDLIDIVEKRIQLNHLSYDDERYDEVEEELHDLEDAFMDKYGDFLEDVLIDIHDEYCPDTEVLPPIAYLAKQYLKKEENGQVSYDITEDQGVWIEIEDLPEKEAHLVVVPNPVRILLMTSPNFKKVIWKG